MMYLVSDNNFCIVDKNKNIPTIRNGESYCAEMGQLRPYKSYDSVIGLTGKELFKWLHKHNYKHITDEAELARLLLCMT